MIDFDAMIAKSAGQVGHLADGCPTVPLETASVPPQVGQLKPSNSKAYSGIFASVPVVPVKNQWTGNNPENRAGEGVAQQSFAQKVDDFDNSINEENPAAVLLLLSWARAKGATREERVALLLELSKMAPADQVRHWHGVCVRDGLKPWHILFRPAPTWGDDCTRCEHLTTRHEAIGEVRQRYHWACGLGYLILEHGRGTERVHVAPPECRSFERWYPSPGR